MKKLEKDTIIEVCHSLLDAAIVAQNSQIKYPESNQNEHLQHLFTAFMYCEGKLQELLKH